MMNSPEVVEDGHVGEHVVDVVGVGRVLVVGPAVGRRHVLVKQRVLRLGLVVHAVQADHVAQEAVEVGVTLRILGKINCVEKKILSSQNSIILHSGASPHSRCFLVFSFGSSG